MEMSYFNFGIDEDLLSRPVFNSEPEVKRQVTTTSLDEVLERTEEVMAEERERRKGVAGKDLYTMSC